MPVEDWIMLGFAGVYTLILISVLLNIGGFGDWVTKRSQKNLRDVEAARNTITASGFPPTTGK